MGKIADQRCVSQPSSKDGQTKTYSSLLRY